VNKQIDWLIIDHYGIDISWEEMLKPYVKKIFVIDDLANRKHDCYMLLDQNLVENYEHRYTNLVSSTCLTLLGPKYALLRKEFREISNKNLQRDDNRILVFFGGTDPTNETVRVVSILEKLPFISNWNIDVIVGNSNSNKEKVKSICERNRNFSYYCQIDNMAEMMAKATIGLMAGGSSTWERYSVGLPALIIAVAENQVEISKFLQSRNFDNFLGVSGELSEAKLAELLTSYLNDVNVKKLVPLFDNHGYTEIIQFLLGDLREIKEEDIELLYMWRNQSFIRENMFYHLEIKWEEHCNWFYHKRYNDNFHARIFEYSGEPIGFVSFQVNEMDNSAQWGFYIGRKNSSRGMGTLLGKLALNFGFTSLELTKVIGEVLPFNEKSLRFHDRLGFYLEEIIKDRYERDGEHYDVFVYGLTKENWKCTSL
jgi:UDP-2,4-diacetamido-2,4,6-trideoxy-beta-L-altropyranose hydrolase/UDP-4-amino-4,6-dideoxy-N-acetyl-beta-L-altrosamine N-acetyltransferase